MPIGNYDPVFGTAVECGERLRKYVGADILGVRKGGASMPEKKRTTRITSRVATQERPVALTLKIDRTMYRRLVGLRATGEKLRTHQDILRQALKEYLDRVGA